MPAVVVTGPRQVGKSNLAKQLAVTDRPYYTLDSLDLLDQARRDPDALVSSPPLIFDEIQRAPELTLAIKRHIDLKRRAGDFLLTGSARLPLLKGVADSLAGRAVYFNLPPFCPREWVEHPDALAPLDALLSGDFTLSDWPTTDQSRSEVWMSWLLRGGLPP
ncbi:MAG: AAA family ATPase, partial [bacterium]